jgi:hypothetical protein
MPSVDPGPGGQVGDVFVPATVGGLGAAFPICRASDLLGSHRSVTTILQRDAISTAHRDEGMTVWVTSTGQLFRLVGGLTNANWVLESSGTFPLYRTYQPGVTLLDPVYQLATGAVDRADASAIATGDVLGIVSAIDVPVIGQCAIAYAGDLAGFVGLTPGDRHLLGTAPGSIVAESDTLNPNYPSAAGEVVKVVGMAYSATGMFVNTMQNLFLL